MKKIIILFLCLFAVLFGLLGCGTQGDEEAVPKASPYEKAKTVPVVNGYSSHIFEGHWKIDDVISGGRFKADEQTILYDLIDDEVTISDEAILYNDIVVIAAPQFECVIVSRDRANDFDPYGQPDDSNDVYYENSPYFVYIHPMGDVKENKSDSPFFLIWNGWNFEFIVKDENTIVFRTEVGLLKAVRISYPEGYGIFP